MMATVPTGRQLACSPACSQGPPRVSLETHGNEATRRRGTISKLFYYAHLTIRAEWANGVFWTPTSKGPVVIPDPNNAADLVADHVEYSLGLIGKTNARTDPASYTVNGYAEAYFGDGRQAALFLEQVRTDGPDELVRRVRSWAGEQFPKLAEIESDDT